MIIVYIVLSLLISSLITALIFQSKNSKLSAQNNLLGTEIEEIRRELQSERDELSKQNSEVSKLEIINKNLQEKLETQISEIKELQSTFSDSFKNLANEILEEKTQKFTELNKNNLDQILKPLRDKIKDFEDKVVNTNEKNRLNNASLIQQIKSLKELNQKISLDAANLTKALKGDVKVQGNWGEMILERILEESGLKKGVEYEAQSSFTQDSKRFQPDVIIKLPEEKHLIIDSKVSLINYEKMINAEEERQKISFLKALQNSVKSHIDGLYSKHYEEIREINSPDFVLLFMPIEGSFSALQQNDTSLYRYALKRHIVIVSPTTLLATLRTISFIWRQENQTKNALEIARQSGALLDKFNGFLEDLEKIDGYLNKTKLSYNAAINKLSAGKGNLLNRVKSIEKLGAKAKKQMPQKFRELNVKE